MITKSDILSRHTRRRIAHDAKSLSAPNLVDSHGANIHDLSAACAPEMDVGGDLAERDARGPELYDVMFEVGGLAGETPAFQAGAMLDVVRGGRDEVALPG